MPTPITIRYGFDTLRMHSAPGIVPSPPALGSIAAESIRHATVVELVRSDTGLTVHGDMSGDLGAAYSGGARRPDLTEVGVAAALEASGRTALVSQPGTVARPRVSDVRMLKVQLPTWRADLEFAERLTRDEEAVPLVLYGATTAYLPDARWAPHAVRGDAVRAVCELLAVDRIQIGQAYRHFPLGSYRDADGRVTVHLQASKGCERTCRYCPYIRVYGRWAARDLAALASDIQALAELGVQHIQFRDQDFASDAQQAIAVSQLFESLDVGIRWSVEGNLDRFTPDVTAAMRRGGCEEVIVGMESSDPAVLRGARRRVLTDTEARAVAVAEMGLRVRGLFMVGLPGDDWSRLAATVQRAIELPLSAAQFNVYAPIPGESFGTDHTVVLEDFVTLGNDFKYRTCPGLSAMEVRLGAALARRAFDAAGHGNVADAERHLSRIRSRAVERPRPGAA